jgi:hypothetical protein
MHTISEHTRFLKDYVDGTLHEMQNNKLENISCLVMAQTIELLGAYLDNKPMRSKGQSAKRFALAIDKLFPVEYSRLNRNSYLYFQLRTNYVHMLLPTNKLRILLDDNKTLHLNNEDGVLSIVPSELLGHVSDAINKIITMLETGKINPKKISTSYIS